MSLPSLRSALQRATAPGRAPWDAGAPRRTRHPGLGLAAAALALAVVALGVAWAGAAIEAAPAADAAAETLGGDSR